MIENTYLVCVNHTLFTSKENHCHDSLWSFGAAAHGGIARSLNKSYLVVALDYGGDVLRLKTEDEWGISAPATEDGSLVITKKLEKNRMFTVDVF